MINAICFGSVVTSLRRCEVALLFPSQKVKINGRAVN